MKIEVHGDNEVILSIEKYTSTEKLIGAVQSACAVVEAAAIKNAPKRSGDLRRSIESNVEGNGNEIKGTISTPLEYAPYRYVRSLNRAKSGKPNHICVWQSRGN